jgi:hypothetical protein
MPYGYGEIPKWLDKRVSEELYRDLMDIASIECDTFISFGGPQDHFERAVLSAVGKVLERVDAGEIKPKKKPTKLAKKKH